MSVQKPFRSASGRPEAGPPSTPRRFCRRFGAVPAADDAVSSTRDSLLHHDPVDVPSVQPASGVPRFGRRSAGWGLGALPAGLQQCAARSMQVASPATVHYGVTTTDDEGSHYGGYPTPTSSSYTYIGSQKARRVIRPLPDPIAALFSRCLLFDEIDKTNGFQKEDSKHSHNCSLCHTIVVFPIW